MGYAVRAFGCPACKCALLVCARNSAISISLAVSNQSAKGTERGSKCWSASENAKVALMYSHLS